MPKVDITRGTMEAPANKCLDDFSRSFRENKSDSNTLSYEGAVGSTCYKHVSEIEAEASKAKTKTQISNKLDISNISTSAEILARSLIQAAVIAVENKTTSTHKSTTQILPSNMQLSTMINNARRTRSRS